MKLNPARVFPHGSVPRPWYSQSSDTSICAVANGEVADDAEAVPLLLRRIALEAAEAEGDVGVALGVEEVGAAQVRVGIGHAGVDAGRGDPHLDPASWGWSRSPVSVAEMSLKRPRTVLIIMCLTANSMLE
ncbi:MAG TPA: hypothetical protein VFQ22_08400 [Longimicrobiales bacterium]|nr:hypothetical protein [Longimicrobiales bacterium]